MQTLFKKYWIEISIGLFTALCSWIVFHFTTLRFPNDDQFILYRYIYNIIQSKGFVYNEGEHVLGATTPLFTLIASACAYVCRGISIPDVVAYLNIIFFSVSSVFLYKIGRFFLPKYFSVFIVLVYILNLTKMIPEGMETPLFLMTLFGFMYYSLSERYYTSAVFLAFTLLTRPDAGLIAVLAVIYWFYRTGWQYSMRLIMLCIIISLPWLVFSTYYFGSFVPQSLATKLHSKDIVHEPSVQGAKVQLAAMSRLYWGKLFDPDNVFFQVLFNLLPFLILIGIAAKKRIDAKTWILFAIPLVYFLSFAVSNPVMFPWYISEMEPIWILLSCIGLYEIYKRIPVSAGKIVLLLVFIIGPVSYYGSFLTTNSQGSKVPLFQMGQYVRNHLHPGETIGISNIGIVGYMTQAPIIDFFGLVNDYAVNYYPIKDSVGCVDESSLYTIPPQLIKDYKPTWIIAGQKEIEPCFYASGWLQNHYVVAYTVDSSTVWKLKSK